MLFLRYRRRTAPLFMPRKRIDLIEKRPLSPGPEKSLYLYSLDHCTDAVGYWIGSLVEGEGVPVNRFRNAG